MLNGEGASPFADSLAAVAALETCHRSPTKENAASHPQHCGIATLPQRHRLSFRLVPRGSAGSARQRSASSRAAAALGPHPAPPAHRAEPEWFGAAAPPTAGPRAVSPAFHVSRSR